jgi:hypothetical protein
VSHRSSLEARRIVSANDVVQVYRMDV